MGFERTDQVRGQQSPSESQEEPREPMLEATVHWLFTGRPGDRRGFQEACRASEVFFMLRPEYSRAGGEAGSSPRSGHVRQRQPGRMLHGEPRATRQPPDRRQGRQSGLRGPSAIPSWRLRRPTRAPQSSRCRGMCQPHTRQCGSRSHNAARLGVLGRRRPAGRGRPLGPVGWHVRQPFRRSRGSGSQVPVCTASISQFLPATVSLA